MIRAVIFDMDGVLIDAKEWHYEALNRALGLFGYEISRTDHLMSFDGLPTRRKLEILSQTDGLPVGLHSFINAMKQDYTMEIVHSMCKANFVQEYALSRLKAQGFLVGVASNSVRSTVEVMMEKAQLARYMDVMLSNQDVSRAKPDPEIYQLAMQRLGIKPEETLIVEDNENGICAARASGACVMVVNDVSDVNWDNINKHMNES
ncbi:putative phosphatase [Gluconacetobacter johannae DSM 13595]|uniref:HAD family phosphatase n=1 Tax=Gluconacetobacter johannae TaxID=112140 RepID=A0A7W4J5N0_9PROT|nr:HAD family phosphatase [Gluconacetobacter johannae]MBB2175160.1 HAD family phosphatase [Gluconacetobacter johannae]GBQ86791.1 putative phosphatase [Gluconacetobacter johannae DSM 13595]